MQDRHVQLALDLLGGHRLLQIKVEVAERARRNKAVGLSIDCVGEVTTGLLEKSVIVSRGKAPSSGKGERYLVRIKRRTYTRASGEKVTTLKTAQIKEYGSEKQVAEPFIRPAFNAKAQQAISVAQTELVKAVERIASKLARSKGGR